MLILLLFTGHAMEEDQIPTFVYNNENGTKWKEELETIDENVIMHNIKESNSYVKEFLYCSISIDRCFFSNNTAFGKSHYANAGGAIYLAFSQFIGKNVHFDDCVASIGGAIASFASKVYLLRNIFKGNIAMKDGGSIYNVGSRNVEIDDFLLCEESSFESCSARCLGGAIFMSNSNDCRFSNCNFISNSASFSGGSVFSNYVKLSFISCRFESNIVNNNLLNYTIVHEIGTNVQISRGGGAISFLSINSKRFYELVTQRCCFVNNTALNGIIFTNGNPGDNILLDGNINYASKGDKIDVKKIIAANSRYSIENNAKILIIDLEKGDHKCNYSNDRPVSIVNYSKLSPINNDDGTTIEVPRPTKYTYVATPITRHPYIKHSPLNTFSSLEFPSYSLPEYTEKHGSIKNESSFNSIPDSLSLTLTHSKTSTYIKTTEWNGNTYISVVTWSETEIVVQTLVKIETSMSLINDTEPKYKNYVPIIISVICCVILIIFVISITIVIYYNKSKKESSSIEEEDYVMALEKIQVARDNTFFITNENPLFKSRCDIVSDDPFRGDFEESSGADMERILEDFTFDTSDNVI